MQLTTATTQKTPRNMLDCDNDVSLTPVLINRRFQRSLTTCSGQRTMATITMTTDTQQPQSPQLTDVRPRSAASTNAISTARRLRKVTVDSVDRS